MPKITQCLPGRKERADAEMSSTEKNYACSCWGYRKCQL